MSWPSWLADMVDYLGQLIGATGTIDLRARAWIPEPWCRGPASWDEERLSHRDGPLRGVLDPSGQERLAWPAPPREGRASPSIVVPCLCGGGAHVAVGQDGRSPSRESNRHGFGLVVDSDPYVLSSKGR